jgi:hypothetical protein
MKKIKKMGKEGGKSRIADFFSQLIFLIFFISVKFPLIVRVDWETPPRNFLFIKIDQITDGYSGKAQIINKLREHDGVQFLNRFQFEYDFVIHDKIRDVRTYQIAFIPQREYFLPFIPDTGMLQFPAHSRLVCRFQQPGSEGIVYGESQSQHRIWKVLMK